MPCLPARYGTLRWGVPLSSRLMSGTALLPRSSCQLDRPAPGSGTGTGTGPGTGDQLVSGLEAECPGTPAPGATPVPVEHPNSKDRHAKAATRRIETLLGRRPPGQPRGDQCRVERSEPKPQVTGSSSGQGLVSLWQPRSPSATPISPRQLRCASQTLVPSERHQVGEGRGKAWTQFASASAFSRRRRVWSRMWRMIRDTCICERPSRSAISVWVHSSW